MSIASDLVALRTKMITALNAISSALVAKGVNPVVHYSDVPEQIAAIPTGSQPTGTKSITENGTYDVTNFASAAVAVPEPSGSTTITTNGTHNVKDYASATVNVPTGSSPTGTIEITTNGTKDVANYASAEVNVPTGTARSSSDITVSGRTVTVPAGLYSSQASKSVATATQATPSISVNTSTGVITATATQSAGYVSAGTKSATQSLTTQAAQTITPGTSNQTISAGRYLTGAQTIQGDSDLVASNIKSGVSIFGVTGTYSGGSDEIMPQPPASPQTYSRTGAGVLTFSGLNVPTGMTLIGVHIQRISSDSSSPSVPWIDSAVVFKTNGEYPYSCSYKLSNSDYMWATLATSTSNIVMYLTPGSNNASGTIAANTSDCAFGATYALSGIYA